MTNPISYDPVHGIEQLGQFTPPALYPDKQPPTVQIVAPAMPSGFMIINTVDFDAATMTLYTGA